MVNFTMANVTDYDYDLFTNGTAPRPPPVRRPPGTLLAPPPFRAPFGRPPPMKRADYGDDDFGDIGDIGDILGVCLSNGEFAGVIIGCIIGGMLLGMLLGILIMYLLKRRRQRLTVQPTADLSSGPLTIHVSQAANAGNAGNAGKA